MIIIIMAQKLKAHIWHNNSNISVGHGQNYKDNREIHNQQLISLANLSKNHDST